LELESGVLARITCGLVAPTDHSLTVVGDGGVLSIADAWDIHSPISWRRGTEPVNLWPDKHLAPAEDYPLIREPSLIGYEASHKIDFAAGLVDMAEALRQDGRPRLSAEHALHVLEVTLALQNAGSGCTTEIRSSFPPPRPMSWAM
jgi:hypothetical protein